MGRTRLRNGFLTTLATVAVGALGAAPALASPQTTVSRTIQDCDGDNLLDWAPGERHVRLDPLAMNRSAKPQSSSGCEPEPQGPEPRMPREASILNFLHMSDFQMVDEESPGRVEFFDYLSRFPQFRPFSSAYRPQESLTTQVTESMVRQARNTTSPVTGAQLDFTILTGDNADSQQYNETRWFIDILDGTTGGEDPDPEMHAETTNDRKIVPDSGIESLVGSCDTNGLAYRDNDSIYDGVRDNGEVGRPDQNPAYYEPDSSGRPGREDGDGYSPNRVRNRTETGDPGADVTVRDFPGLLEDAQEPFEAVGLGMPWYSGFGNHDALVQGNSGSAYIGPFGGPTTEVFNATYHAIVTGCLKPTNFPPSVLAKQGTDEFVPALLDFLRNPGAYLDETTPVVVPPDPRRCYLAKSEPKIAAPESPCETGGFVEQHLRTTGTPVGHGFAPAPPPPNDKECEGVDRRDDGCIAATLGRPPEAILHHDGYYSFAPRPRLRFIMLDTVTDECPAEPLCSEGSVDNVQFEWLRRQLRTAQDLGQYVVVFSHHTLQTTRLPSSDPSEQPIHFGERTDADPQPEPPSPGQTLEELYCQNPNVLAHVDGHEHENFVKRFDCRPGEPARNFGGFTEISTAAHIDWPQQSRQIELIEEPSDTPGEPSQVSFVLTIVDHDGPAYPGGVPQCRVTSPTPAELARLAGCELRVGGQSGEEPVRLSSIARELAYNDYQNSRTSRGGREDRNVIVPTGRPWGE